MKRLYHLVVFLVCCATTLSAQTFTPPFGLSYKMGKEDIRKVLLTNGTTENCDAVTRCHYYPDDLKLNGFAVKEITCIIEFDGLLSTVFVNLKYVSKKNYTNLKMVYEKLYGNPTETDESVESVTWVSNDGTTVYIHFTPTQGNLCIMYFCCNY